jgi:hypothetical protein
MRKNTVIGFIYAACLTAAGLLTSAFRHAAQVFGKKYKVGIENFKRMEFSNNTQRLGLRFTERIRDIFRFKWIKKA